MQAIHRQFLGVQQDLGSFADYIWQFVDGRPRCTLPVKMPQTFLFVRIQAN
ncbi:MAG: hypothetical protein PHO08_10610 [Methylococcales bacterium]|nr:hypothetical protein [Methylococcales bacterium]